MGAKEEESNLQEDCVGPEILECEVRAAVKELKNGKAVGADCVPGEFLKALGEEGMKKLTELCKKIYNEGVWPEEHTRVIMIPLQKKANRMHQNFC